MLNAASLHLIIDFVLYSFTTTKKIIVDTQQSAPFINCFSNFTVLVKVATQRYRVQTHRRFSKTTRKSMRISQTLFGLGK
jgi:hypothetical protein